MKIGFYIKWAIKFDPLSKRRNILGEKCYADSYCKYLKRIDGVESVDVYAVDCPPQQKVDVMIYMNDTPPNPLWADKHVLFLQNFYKEGSDEKMRELYGLGYDGYVFFGDKLFEKHPSDLPKALLSYIGIDEEIFYPRQKDPALEFPVTYVGNDIKGEQRTVRYVLPATQIEGFALYGNWYLPSDDYIPWWKFRRLWKRHLKMKNEVRPYQKVMRKFCRGNMLNEKLPELYSNAKIVLNCTGEDSVGIGMINMRPLEVFACKGFLLTDYLPKKLEGCAVLTEGGDDLLEKIDYYLKNPQQREEIAQRGYQWYMDNARGSQMVKELYDYLCNLGVGV